MRSIPRWCGLLICLCLLQPVQAQESGDLRSLARRLLEEGESLVRGGDLRRGCLRMELAFATAPEWWYGAYVLAVTCRRGKQGDQRYLLQGAVHRGPAEAHSVRAALADLHIRVGVLDRAEAGYRQVLQHDPTSRSALVGLARIAERRQDWQMGSVWLKKALYYRDSDVQSRWLLAGLTERAGDVSGAEEHLRYLVRYGPDRRRFVVELWRFYLRHGREGIVRALGPGLRQREGGAGVPALPAVQFPLSGTP